MAHETNNGPTVKFPVISPGLMQLRKGFLVGGGGGALTPDVLFCFQVGGPITGGGGGGGVL